MPLILNIETATDVCSVALSKDGLLLSMAESDEPKSHAGTVTKFIRQVMRESKLKLSQIDAVAISKGPGSYTGLRIGTATAKGLCYALNRPLIAVNTLESMTSFFLSSYPGISNLNPRTLFAPVIDARRMEVYTAVFDSSLNELLKTKAEIITENSFSELLKENKIVFFGDGADKCARILGTKSAADFIKDFKTSARGMLSLSAKAFNETKWENMAYFEPYYLKDFVANKPKN